MSAGGSMLAGIGVNGQLGGHGWRCRRIGIWREIWLWLRRSMTHARKSVKPQNAAEKKMHPRRGCRRKCVAPGGVKNK